MWFKVEQPEKLFFPAWVANIAAELYMELFFVKLRRISLDSIFFDVEIPLIENQASEDFSNFS